MVWCGKTRRLGIVEVLQMSVLMSGQLLDVSRVMLEEVAEACDNPSMWDLNVIEMRTRPWKRFLDLSGLESSDSATWVQNTCVLIYADFKFILWWGCSSSCSQSVVPGDNYRDKIQSSGVSPNATNLVSRLSRHCIGRVELYRLSTKTFRESFLMYHLSSPYETSQA